MTNEEYLLYYKKHNISINPQKEREPSRLDYLIYCFKHGINPEPDKNGEELRKVSSI